jgi:hypothetical protein
MKYKKRRHLKIDSLGAQLKGWNGDKEELKNQVGGGRGIIDENQDRINQRKKTNCTFLPLYSQFFWEPLGSALLIRHLVYLKQ